MNDDDPRTVACAECQSAMPAPASGPVLCSSCYLDAPKKVRGKMQNALLESAIAEILTPKSPASPNVPNRRPDIGRKTGGAPRRRGSRWGSLDPEQADLVVEAIELRRTGLTIRGVAAAMGRPRATVHTWIQRGLRMTIADAVDALRADETALLAELSVTVRLGLVEPKRVDGRIVKDPQSCLAVRDWSVANQAVKLGLGVLERKEKLYGMASVPVDVVVDESLGSDAEQAAGVTAVGNQFAEFDRRLERQEDAKLAAAQKRVRGEHELARRTRRNKDRAAAAVFEPPEVTASYTEDVPVPVAPVAPPVDAQAVRDAAERRQMNAAIRRRAF